MSASEISLSILPPSPKVKYILSNSVIPIKSKREILHDFFDLQLAYRKCQCVTYRCKAASVLAIHVHIQIHDYMCVVVHDTCAPHTYITCAHENASKGHFAFSEFGGAAALSSVRKQRALPRTCKLQCECSVCERAMHWLRVAAAAGVAVRARWRAAMIWAEMRAAAATRATARNQR